VLSGKYGTEAGIRERVFELLNREFPNVPDVGGAVMTRLPDGFESQIKASSGPLTTTQLGKLAAKGISNDVAIWIAEQKAAGVPDAEIVSALGDDSQTVEDYNDTIIWGY
jgi:hypothetical protein